MAKFAGALLEAHRGRHRVRGRQDHGQGRAGQGQVVRRGRRRSPIFRCRCPQGMEPGLSDEAFFEPTNNTYPFGCHIVLLEIDRETGEPKLLQVVAVGRRGKSDQPADRRGPDSRRAGAGNRPGDDRRGRLQRGRPAAHRLVHGLRAAARDRLPAFEMHSTVHADAGQPARRQGRRRSRHARLNARARLRRGGRVERVRREAHRHDAQARKALADHSGPSTGWQGGRRDSDAFRLPPRVVAR